MDQNPRLEADTRATDRETPLPAFYEAEYSLPCSQDPSTRPYLKAAECT